MKLWRVALWSLCHSSECELMARDSILAKLVILSHPCQRLKLRNKTTPTKCLQFFRENYPKESWGKLFPILIRRALNDVLGERYDHDCKQADKQFASTTDDLKDAIEDKKEKQLEADEMERKILKVKLEFERVSACFVDCEHNLESASRQVRSLFRS